MLEPRTMLTGCDVDSDVASIIGDANNDSIVDFDDFLSLSAGFGKAGGWSEGDFSCDGNVDFDDFLLLSRNYGSSAPADANVDVALLDSDSFMDHYVGGFRLPNTDANDFTFRYIGSGRGLAVSPESDALYITAGNSYPTNECEGCRENANSIVTKISIPDVLSTDPAEMQTSTLLQFTNLRGTFETDALGIDGVDFAGNGDSAKKIAIDDLVVVDGKLVGSAYVGYDVAPPFASHSHFVIDTLDLDNVFDENVTGLFSLSDELSFGAVGTNQGGFLGGFMTEIPAEWQSELGGTHLTGQGGLSGIYRTSVGPAAFAFDAASLGEGATLHPTELLYYPLQPNNNVLAWVDYPQFEDFDAILDSPVFNFNTSIEGVTFIPETRTLLFLGSTGATGLEDDAVAYTGYGTPDVYNDTARTDKGPHSQDGSYEYQAWAYDIDDLIAARNGDVAPWDVQPYDVFRFDFPDMPDAEPAKYFGGTTFDPNSNRLYVTQFMPDTEHIVQVFQF